jgi:hypothetical protein
MMLPLKKKAECCMDKILIVLLLQHMTKNIKPVSELIAWIRQSRFIIRSV